MNEVITKRVLSEATRRLVNSNGPNMPAFATLLNAAGELLSEWTGETVHLKITAEGQSESVDMKKAPNVKCPS